MSGNASRKNGHLGGRPKGKYDPSKALEKQAIRDIVRAMVSAHLVPMTEAQIAHANGLKYLVSRDKAGKFTRIGPEGVTGDAGEVIEVWEKDPSSQAYADLMNRAADKPIEPPQDVNLHADDAILAILSSARRRDKAENP